MVTCSWGAFEDIEMQEQSARMGGDFVASKMCLINKGVFLHACELTTTPASLYYSRLRKPS